MDAYIPDSEKSVDQHWNAYLWNVVRHSPSHSWTAPTSWHPPPQSSWHPSWAYMCPRHLCGVWRGDWLGRQHLKHQYSSTSLRLLSYLLNTHRFASSRLVSAELQETHSAACTRLTQHTHFGRGGLAQLPGDFVGVVGLFGRVASQCGRGYKR